jgi:archaemetzincin
MDNTNAGRIAARAVFASVFFVLGVLGPALQAPETAHLPEPVLAYNAAQGKTIHLRPLGGLTEPQIDFLARTLQSRTGLPVVLMPPASLPVETWSFERGQYDGERILDWMFVTRPEGAWRYLAVTSDDVYAPDVDMVYGYANTRDRVAVVSLHRFLEDLEAEDPDRRAVARDRVVRAAFHEIGHTLGLRHCETEGCLMSAIMEARQIGPHTAPCPKCVYAIQAALDRPRNSVEEHVALGDGFHQRGRFEQALDHYREARFSAESLQPLQTAALLNRHGAALLSMERLAVGELFIRRALDLRPDFAPALFNLAVVQVAAGDHALAFETLAQWRRAVPDPRAQHGMAARFFLEMTEDLGSAVRELRSYKAAGGDDRRLLLELDRLDGPGFVVFDEPLVIEH